jgi:hypothetical protein
MRKMGIVSLLLAAALSQAQGPDEKLLILKKQAQELANAMVSDDHQKLTDRTHPLLVEKLGGREKMIATLEMISKKIRAQWPTTTVKLNDAKEIAENKGEYYGIVPFTLKMRGKDTTITVESYLIGFSGDAGKNWVFVDAGNKSMDLIKQLLPNLPKELRLPETSKPKVEKSN